MRILSEQTVAVVIDLQEKLLPVMTGNQELLARTEMLLNGLNLLGVPVAVTEQYPRGLGETVEEIQPWRQTVPSFEKMAFSCADCPDFMDWLALMNRPRILILGIEAHVCVLQTVVDLLEAGYQPVVVQDCVSSRKEEDRQVALARMQQEGARITTAESILFELTRRAGTDVFKAISRLVK